MLVQSEPYVIIGVPAALVSLVALTPALRSCRMRGTRFLKAVTLTFKCLVARRRPPEVPTPSNLAERLAVSDWVRQVLATALQQG